MSLTTRHACDIPLGRRIQVLMPGRLYQVEYAMEAISHAGVAVGILAQDGIVLAAEKKITSKLLEVGSSEKMYKVDDHLACGVAGLNADANILVNYARVAAQRHTLTYGEPTPLGAPNSAVTVDTLWDMASCSKLLA